jgi:hypothetical protein
MQKMIWIPDDLADEIKDYALRRGKSFSQYLVDLHRSVSGDQKVVEYPVEAAKEMCKSSGTERLYSDDYRKKNPMESCWVCGKALKFNCGH